ncbi:MAG: hypothetical protein A2504_09540 [Bdellovibrionales bacterium RIFOXYD12_FULL_39_22]|nr:MAG: hypothetical protein A2385_13030 [Bdellovibrionales bacterium RIFOXYB1_FULL_39_21]OFZ40969.1 MAG: hypothetical protein A2485_16540 [Bdellovibrionales bacterium RIFOXYC12_FULL_39_17]OFZ44797.1 MAG: hypothetical protein A2404_09830 [Bdellovibrionales bacterium RIFOXYC1_FULL_39_130]OFZ73588.1 MAG: hypothetical protein A2451_06430 [Bdellovibrionales bacterium RIFOXYC2_FULL_39_8]OFZ74262.1 MAG: hypothetical protein A2560_16795 [Bdellovibrionales bacterium RIFOXYD1_FULL_39_84]OFZ92126.1 MAG:
MGDPFYFSLALIDDKSNVVRLCALPALCTPTKATLNHLHWIDGIDDKSGIDLEVNLLSFLAKN